MARICCLAGVDPKDIPLLGDALEGAGEVGLTIVPDVNVAALGKLAPDVLVADIDRQEVDALELLRQVRFVLPNCVVVVYTGTVRRAWGRDCHLAGANCVLSKLSRKALLVSGLQRAIRTGCFTDPRFAA
jgi:DNA-binding NarL/FixJ family response regulator